MAKKADGSTPFDEPPVEPKKGRGPIMDEEMKVMNAINRAISNWNFPWWTATRTNYDEDPTRSRQHVLENHLSVLSEPTR